MKAAPTLDGRVRIDPESELDLIVLRSIIPDAQGNGEALAARLGTGMDPSASEDWEDFVKPDLEEQFNQQVLTVAGVLAEAKPGVPLFIGKEDSDSWYGALNQARLALHDQHGFDDEEELEEMSEERAAARIRSHFYQVLQGLLLDVLMFP
ncbi:DUF2017 family protein [Haloferula rosea]|uniref:DUF2017 family protein n=1 Tax=Haloferula rosea TaxID=490093 RepID=A0A934RG50_9BACT|nr:DUF2017 family protein [Haloferula rosea]MBK1827916.1 DUF2017 family protein [Haloferula rosea]